MDAGLGAAAWAAWLPGGWAMIIKDPLHVPGALRGASYEYQWIDAAARRNLGRTSPEETGWFLVRQDEMPNFDLTVGPLQLYRRDIKLHERVVNQEQAVAKSLLDEATAFAQRGGQAPLPRIVRPLTSPRGPLPEKWNMRDGAIYAVVWFRRYWGLPESSWLVEKFCGTNAVGIKRWSEENRVMPAEYVSLHTQAILDGKGRWPGQIIRAARR